VTEKHPPVRTEKENLEMYKALVARLQRYPVNPRFRAVHLIRSGLWVASGTVLVGRNWIVTCEHFFPPSQLPDYLYCQEFQPPLPDLMEICRFLPDEGDIGFCEIGPATPISYQSKFHKPDWIIDHGSYIPYKLREVKLCRYLATGEEVRLLGYIEIPGIPSSLRWVLEYHSCPGESGAGFITDGDGILVHTESLFVMEEHRNFFGINPKFETVSLAIGIKL
jgi:hypothetical protein